MTIYRRRYFWANAITSSLLIFSQVVYPFRDYGALLNAATPTARLIVKGVPAPQRAEAIFMEALNGLLNLPADASPELAARAEQKLQAAAGQYQLALQRAPKTDSTSAPTGSPYLYTANAQAPNGDTSAWTLLARPQGDAAVFEQSFSAGLAGRDTATIAAAGLPSSVEPVEPYRRETQSGLAVPALTPTVRQCGRVRVRADRIDIGENGDNSDAEWRLDVSVAGNNRDWDVDGIEDNTTHGLGFEWFVDLSSDSTSFSINSGGVEYDTPDPDDPLPGASADLNSGNNWNIGGDRTIGGSNSDASYTLHYFVDCDGPTYADLGVSLSDSPDPLPAGDSLSYSASVVNNGPTTATGVRLTLNLPTSLSNVSPSASQGSGCTAQGGGVYQCDLGDLNNGASASVSVSATTAYSVETLNASASVSMTSADKQDLDGSNNDASTSTTTLPVADTAISLSAPVAVTRNHSGATTYQVTAAVSNAGPTIAPGTAVVYSAPAGVTLTALTTDTGSCALDTATCDLGTLAVGGSATITATLSVEAGIAERADMAGSAVISMQAAGATELTPGNNSATHTSRLTFWDQAIGATGPGGTVNALLARPGTLIAAGDFGVRQWDGSAWSDVGAGGPSGVVYALIDDGAGGLYAAGDFTNLGPRLARWDGANWSGVGAGVNGPVYALALSGSELIVGGAFSQAGTLVTNNVARWDGTTWRTLGVAGVTQGYGANQPQVRALAVHGNDIYVAGLFRTPAVNIARWNRLADSWSALGSGIAYPGGASVVHALTLSDGRLYVGGRFTSAGGVAANRIAAWDLTDERWVALGAGLAGAGSLAVNAIAVTRGDLLVGGSFTTAGGVAANNVARWNGAAWQPLGAGADSGPVNAVAGRDAESFSGGVFTGVDSVVGANRIGSYTHPTTSLALGQTLTPATPVAGQALSIVLTVTNSGNAATAVTVRDELPADVILGSATSSQGTCATSGQVVTCALGAVVGGGSATITLDATVATTIQSAMINRAWVGARERETTPADNAIASAGDVISQADLAVTLSAPASATAGQSFDYALLVQNAGPAVASGTVVTLTLPTGGATFTTATGLTCAATSAYADDVAVRCTVGDLAPGASVTGTVNVTVLADTIGAIGATATATATLTDPEPANSSQTVSTTIGAVADLTLTLAEPQRVYLPPSSLPEYIYTLTLTSAGPSAATDAAIALTLPAAVTFVSATGGCSRSGQVVTCATESLAPGAILEASVRVAVNYGTPGGTLLVATAVASSDAGDPQTADNSTSASTVTSTDFADAVADLGIDQNVPTEALAGDTALYTLRVTNAGAAATTFTLTDTLPAGTTFDPSLSDPACFEAEPAGTVVCAGIALQVGEVRVLDLGISVPVTATVGALLNNNAAVVGELPDPDAGNNTSVSQVPVATSADLVVTQEASANEVAAGETVTYTVTIENLGPSIADTVTLTDTEPAGVVLQTAEPSQGVCAIDSGVATCDLGDLDVAAQATVTVTFVAGSGEVDHSALVAAITPDPDPDTNVTSAALVIASAGRSTRTFGAVDVSADTFIDLPDGRVQAFGDVWLGAYYRLAGDTDSVVIDGQDVTGEGTLELLQEGLGLFAGDFSGSFADDAATLAPEADVDYLLNSIAGFALVELAISQVDLVTGRADGQSDTLEVETDGFARTLSANLFVAPGPTYGGTVEAFSFDVSGVTFDVSGARLFTEGLGADDVTMTLPPAWGDVVSTVNDLEITPDGISLGGASATVPMPDFQLSGDEVQMLENTLSVIYNGEDLMLIGEGTLAIDLPDNAQESRIAFSIDPAGRFDATLDQLTLGLASATLELSDVAANNNGLSVAQGVLTLPESLNGSTVTVREVTITTDGIEVGGGAVVLALPDIDIGDGSRVRFSAVEASLEIDGGAYVFGLAGTLQLRLPQNAQDIAITAQVDQDGNFSGTVDAITLALANTSLQLEDIAFDSEGLTVAIGTLVLPESLGGGTATLEEITIDESGLSIGGGSVSFAFPDVRLGSRSGFAVTDVVGTLSFAADRTYKLTLEGTVNINVKTSETAVKGSITVDSQGRFTGTIDSFLFTVAGLELSVTGARVADGVVTVEEAAFKAPESWGGAEVAVYNLRLSSSGVRIGGGRFALPPIQAGSVSLGGLYGELREEGAGYVITAGGSFRVAGLGGPNCMLGVGATMYVDGPSGATVLELDTPTEELEGAAGMALRQVNVGLEGCRIAIGATGFYLTRVEGTLTLASNQTTIDLGVTVANDGEFVEGDAEMHMGFNPWQLDFAGSITLFSIFKAAELDATIRSGYFSADLRLRQVWPPIEGQVSVTAWTTDGSFHLIGRATVALVFRKGSVWEECLVGLCVSIPPLDLKLAELGAEFGEFRKDNGSVWGLKGWATVLSFSVGFYVDTDGDLDVGNVDGYRLISPPDVAQWRAWESQRELGRPLDLDAEEHGLWESINADDQTVTVREQVPTATDLMFVLVREGVAPTLSLIDPNGRAITPDSLPYNVRLSETGTVTTTQTIYTVMDAAPGEWQAVLTGAAPGTNYLYQTLGANPAPTLTDLAAVNTGPTTARADWALTSDEITTTLDIFATVGPLSTTHTITATGGFTRTVVVPLYTGFPVAQAIMTPLDGAPAHTALDLSALASGQYWLWFNADDGRNPPTRGFAATPIVVTHNWAAAWTANLTATPGFRGFALHWGDHPNPDVDAYRLEVGTQPGLVDSIHEIGDLRDYMLDSLTPGQAYYLRLVGVDRETGRTSRSETLAVVAQGATFDLSAPTAALTVTAGATATVTLDLATTTDPYPTSVSLYTASLPDGVAADLSVGDVLTPTTAGISVPVAITTTASMAGGVYDLVFRAVGDGLQDEAIVHLTVLEPHLVVAATPSSATLATVGGDATVTLSATALHGATQPVELDLLDVPTGLVSAFSAPTLGPGGSVTLALTDTAALANGVYTLHVRAEAGLRQDLIPLTLTVQKPDFTLTPILNRMAVNAGEEAVFAIGLAGANLTGPITFTLGANTSPVPSGASGFADSATKTPRATLTRTAPGTAYFIVETGVETPEGPYRFEILAQADGLTRREIVEVTVTRGSLEADLGVTQSLAETGVDVGGLITSTVRVVNVGPRTATTVTLTDTLPVGTTLVSATASRGVCRSVAGAVTCDLYALRRGAAADVTVVGRVAAGIDPGVTLTNVATASADQPDAAPGDNVSVASAIATAQADLRVSVADTPDPVIAGAELTYSLVVVNQGPSEAPDVRLSAALPAGLTVRSILTTQGDCGLSADGHSLSCDLGRLGAAVNDKQATVLLRVRVAPSVRGTLALPVSARSSVADATPGNNTITATTRVSVDVALRITHQVVAPSAAVAGETLTYQLIVTNTGRSDATHVVVADTLPTALQSVESATATQGRCAVIDTQVTCQLGTLPPQTTATITLVGIVAPGTRLRLDNAASVDAAEPEHVTGDNATRTLVDVTARADLRLTLGSAQPSHYQFTIDNVGPSTASGVVLTGTVSADFTVLQVLTSQGTCTLTGRAFTCQVGALDAQGRAVVVIVGAVRAGAFSTAASGGLTGIEVDRDPANNTADLVSAGPVYRTYMPWVAR